MVQLKDISMHDLIYLIVNDSENKWCIITELSRPIGCHIVAHPLGDMDHRIYISDEESGLILRHHRIAAVPGAIEALEAYERAIHLAENESPEALNEWIEASNDATTKVLTALRAVRGRNRHE